MIAPSSGNKTMAWYISALHQIDVFHRDRAPVAVKHHQNGKANGGLRCRHRQHQKRKDLTDDIAQKARERDKIDIDRKQDQLDRHQYDDDILPVEKDAEDSEGEQDRGDRKIMPEADRHGQIPCPGCTLRISIAVSLVRATCTEMFCRFTFGLCRSVSTIAPIIA